LPLMDGICIMCIVYLVFSIRVFLQFKYVQSDNCERNRAKRGELAERSSIRGARELLFNVWGLEQGVSRKLSIFDIWCIEQKMFVFTWISKVRHKKNSTRPGPNLTLIECLYLGKYDTYEKTLSVKKVSSWL